MEGRNERKGNYWKASGVIGLTTKARFNIFLLINLISCQLGLNNYFQQVRIIEKNLKKKIKKTSVNPAGHLE